MKTKTISILFIVVALIVVGTFVLSAKYGKSKEKSLNRAKIVTPKSSSQNENTAERKLSTSESEKYETFVPLQTGETLISTLTMDFNSDGYDDEIIVVRVNTSPNLYLVPGIYDAETGNYHRCKAIPTTFTKTRTFSYTGMDLIGDHSNALIYQGLDDNGNYVMQIFVCHERRGVYDIQKIGDFVTDGTVFIQQVERSESYELSLSKGESFSIWVYESEKSEDGKKSVSATGANQIQKEYKWSAVKQQYELARSIKVTAGSLAAAELSKIQDGTVETFSAFLNGLWYKTSNNDQNIRYLFFDPNNHEIIQFYSDIQEIYEWQDSKIRHNGILLTTVNSEIMNLHRRFDISLNAVDEIKLTLRDDVNLIIKENTMWDGTYKKLSIQSSFDGEEKENSTLKKVVSELKRDPAWISADTLLTLDFEDLTYSVKTENFIETGIYSCSSIGSYNIVQFRSDAKNSLLSESYAIEFGTKTITEKVKRKTVEKQVTDYDNVVLTPIKITPTDCFVTEGKVYTFTR